MKYWIFKANPEKYDLDQRLRNPEPQMIWAVTRYQERIQKGDLVFVWRAGKPRGLCAVMEVEVNPYQPDPPGVYTGFVDSVENAAPISISWAKCRLTQRFPLIEADTIKKIPGLELFSFFSAFPQATNLAITRPEGMILLEFIEKHLAERSATSGDAGRKPATQPTRPEPVRAKKTGKGKAAGRPATQSAEFELLKCGTCGRYVVKVDAERHIREAHPGQPVEWEKTK